MRAPKFDITRLPTTASAADYMRAVLDEEKRVCGAIDARLTELENEFLRIAKQVQDMQRKQAESGFFRRFVIGLDIKELTRRLDDNRTMRHELMDARWRRTYA